MTSGKLHLGPRAKLATHILGPAYDESQDGYDLLKPIYNYLARYPLTGRDLAAVEALTFDGGNDVYPYAFPFWDGETDEFDVRSLAGLERLINLRSFNVISLLVDTDLAPFAGLQRLEHVDLGLGEYQNAQSLLRLPGLQSLSCSDGAFSDSSIVPALKARGVRVRLYH